MPKNQSSSASLKLIKTNIFSRMMYQNKYGFIVDIPRYHYESSVNKFLVKQYMYRRSIYTYFIAGSSTSSCFTEAINLYNLMSQQTSTDEL